MSSTSISLINTGVLRRGDITGEVAAAVVGAVLPKTEAEWLAMDEAEWSLRLASLATIQELSGWTLAHFLALGIDRWGGRYYYQQDGSTVDRIAEVAIQIGKGVKTLENYLAIARKFSPDRVPEGVTIGHCNILTGLSIEEQDGLLIEVAEQGLSIEALKAKVADLKGKPKPAEIPALTSGASASVMDVLMALRKVLLPLGSERTWETGDPQAIANRALSLLGDLIAQASGSITQPGEKK